MKKTISINIAGLIFYIEEDGYDKLRQYLAAVHRYFSAFADSTEIVADIESRVAERFLIKQKNENKQAISVSDVDELIKAMGNVSDFEAAEEAEDLISEPLHSAKPGAAENAGEKPPVQPTRERPSRGRFYRDLKRKILGGIASGIAHYYAMDPLWVRLLLLLGIFGMVPVSGIFHMHLEENFAVLSGILIVGYIAMWIAFPGSITLEDNQKVKKFYRDPERKVLGGVASGLSSYFDVDTGVIRFIWVMSIFFFGTGLLAYIILWAIAPAANTLTEKMEMQGEPITLFNIDTNIKRNLEGAVGAVRESDAKRLLLLPFTIIGKILNALGKALRELGPVIRVLLGIVMVGVAAMSLLSLLIFAAILLGMSGMPDFGVFPSEFLVLKDMPGVLILSVATLVTVPVVVVLFLGLMLLFKRRVIGATAWIVVAGLFVFSLVGAVSSGLVFQRNFSETGEYIQQNRFAIGTHTLTLDGEDRYSNKHVYTSVFLKGVSGKDSLLVRETYFAQAADRSEAREIASQVAYAVEKSDSVLFVPDGPLRSETLPYRNQHIEVTLELPYHRPFAMTRAFFLGRLERSSTRRNLEGMDIRHHDLNWSQLRWAILPDSGLVCLNFPERFKNQKATREEVHEHWDSNEAFDDVELGERGEFVKQFAVSEFKGIDLGGAYRILIKKGDRYTVTLDGPEANVDALNVRVDNGLLHIEQLDPKAGLPESGSRIGVVVVMPDLETVAISGASMLKVEGFENLSSLRLRLSGATLAELRVNQVATLDLDLSGASKMVWQGNATDLKATLSGSCLLKAGGSSIRNAEVSASGVSRALLGSVENLSKRETGQSRISRIGE